MKRAGLAAIAFAVLTGLALPASAATLGTISTSVGHNDGVHPIYGKNVRSGFFDANLYLTGLATVTVTFLGSEAGLRNSFWWGGTKIFETAGGTNSFSKTGFGKRTFTNVAGGLLNFAFGSSGVVTDTNGDNSRPDPNFFVSFGSPKATHGRSLILWFDDNGSVDDNHDDMAIRLKVSGPRAVTFSEVPVPAAGFLMLGGLGALAGLRRRRKV